MRKLGRNLSIIMLLLAVGTVSVHGQGRGGYMNVESPHVHPIEVAHISGHDYLLAVNTPDNALEIWDTDESVPQAQRFLARMPTGLEPVSVRWVPSLGLAYVANFLGDSITAIAVRAPNGPSSLNTTLLATAPVTDEPLDLAFAEILNDDGSSTPTLFVTHMTLDAYSRLHAKTLLPIAPGDARIDPVVASGQDLDFDTQADDIALKEPWAPAVFCDQLFILGHKGGNSDRYDFDLFVSPLAGGPARSIGNVGSTNWNMSFGANGDLYIVGAQSRNKNLIGETLVKNANTGFVKSMFYLVENPCGDNPKIHRRDVNLVRAVLQIDHHDPLDPDGALAGSTQHSEAQTEGSPDGKMIVQPLNRPVRFQDALAQLTSLVAFERSGAATKVFFTAMSSDRVGVIEPNASVAAINWPRRKIDITPVTPGAMAGPRGIALRPASVDGTVPARLYVLNRLDPSITVIDPVTETEVAGMSFPLATTNIEPASILAGRRFLYDARLSGNGFVSCSSCHPDARTDGQAWQLSDFMPVPVPEELNFFDPNNLIPDDFAGDKGFIVTQSLQGLLNYEVPPDIQELYSNKPYHWRGDRADFQAFNGAFASLLGGSILEDGEIAAYEEFINTVHYPPNPKQDASRIYSGTLGDPDDPAGGAITQNHSGTGALKGMKLFHTGNSDGFSCSGCHALMEGSDNTLTEFITASDPFPLETPPLTVAPAQHMETAALRGLFQREARLDKDGDSFPEFSPISGFEGLFHTGLVNSRPNTLDFNGTASINAFNLRFFDVSFCTNQVAQLPSFCDNLRSINQFTHELDWGVGPVVGRSYTVTQANAFSPATNDAFKLAEIQAGQANAGFAIQASIAGTLRGFWYDLTGNAGSAPIYVEEPSGATFTRTALQSLVTGTRDRMVLISTPLGSERRVGTPDGQPTFLTGSAPSSATLLPMVTNSAYEQVPSLREFWDLGVFFAGAHGHTIRLYQNALLIDAAAQNGFGLCTVRHEAPRRFRLTGKGIRHGARLHLWVPEDTNRPDTTIGPRDPGQVNMRRLELPIHPTDERDDNGHPIWETAAELDPRLFYRMMTGPPVHPLLGGILDNLNDRDFRFLISLEALPPGTWDPPGFNNHYVVVENSDTSTVDGGWQSLSIEPGPLCP